eukprot:276820-Pelagomonas_calceolata.AAC.5
MEELVNVAVEEVAVEGSSGVDCNIDCSPSSGFVYKPVYTMSMRSVTQRNAAPSTLVVFSKPTSPA